MTTLTTRFTALEITDRVSGTVERIPLDDADESVRTAAKSIGLNDGRAWQLLLEGQTLTTAGFVRRLVKSH